MGARAVPRSEMEANTSFLPIGIAVIGDLSVLEINGNRVAFLNDRITFGSPGIGSGLKTDAQSTSRTSRSSCQIKILPRKAGT